MQNFGTPLSLHLNKNAVFRDMWRDFFGAVCMVLKR